MALRNFVRGFLGELKAGEILTSPLGRILEGYFLLKFGPNLVKKMSSIAGAELPDYAEQDFAELWRAEREAMLAHA